MRLPIWFNTGLLFGLLFIAIGDSFLPKPLSNISLSVRKTLNKAMIDWATYEEKKEAQESLDKPIKQPKKSNKKRFESPGEFFDRVLEEAERETNAID